jgi:hypothetical protein
VTLFLPVFYVPYVFGYFREVVYSITYNNLRECLIGRRSRNKVSVGGSYLTSGGRYLTSGGR